MIEKQTAITQKTVTEDGTVLIQQTTRIIESGVQISESFHRCSLTPGQDVAAILSADGKFAADLIPGIVEFCAREWSPEIIAAYRAQFSAQTV